MEAIQRINPLSKWYSKATEDLISSSTYTHQNKPCLICEEYVPVTISRIDETVVCNKCKKAIMLVRERERL